MGNIHFMVKNVLKLHVVLYILRLHSVPESSKTSA